MWPGMKFVILTGEFDCHPRGKFSQFYSKTPSLKSSLVVNSSKSAQEKIAEFTYVNIISYSVAKIPVKTMSSVCSMVQFLFIWCCC